MNMYEPRSDSTWIGVKEGLTPLGEVELIRGRLVVFPNCHVTKMTRLVKQALSSFSFFELLVSQAPN